MNQSALAMSARTNNRQQCRRRLHVTAVFLLHVRLAMGGCGEGGRTTADAITRPSWKNSWQYRATGGNASASSYYAFVSGNTDPPSRTATARITTCGVGSDRRRQRRRHYRQQQQPRLWFIHNRNGVCTHVDMMVRGGHSSPKDSPKEVTSMTGPRRRCRETFEKGGVLTLPASVSPRGEAMDTKDQSRRTKVGISVALFATYYCVMFAKSSLPATLSLLVGDNSGLRFFNAPSSSLTPPQNAQAAMARVLSLSTIFLSIGKLVLGPVIDAVTGISCLKAALFVLLICLGTISQTTTFRHFALAWICVDFVFSACWAACLNAIHASFEEEEWPEAIGMLAIAARTGNACAFLAFGGLLEFIESWRVVFALSAAIQTIPICLLSMFAPQEGRPPVNTCAGKKGIAGASSDGAEQASGRSTRIHDSLRVLRSVAKGAPFWLHLMSRAALMVYASFLMFVPSLMSNCFGLSSALAAKTGSLYALGCLLAVSVGSKPYNNLKSPGKIVANVTQLGIATVAALTLLLHVRGAVSLAPSFGIFLMFLWGVSFAVPFYIPSSIFALERGGKESSATISDCFDFFGFLCLAVFNGHAASIQQNVMIQWSMCFGILASCSATSLICLTLLELISD